MERLYIKNRTPSLVTEGTVTLHQLWLEQTGSTLFPSPCVFSVQRYDRPDISFPPLEDVTLHNAVETRHREFSAGRTAAQTALLKLGITKTRIPIGPNRNPLWPPGIVGSITHTAGLAIAVVAKKEDLRAAGLDLERNNAVLPELWKLVLDESEIDYISAKPPNEQARTATLIFSAKESFYKMQYPLTGQWIDFHEARVTITEGTDTFELICRHSLATDRLRSAKFSGKYVIGPELTLTAIYLEK